MRVILLIAFAALVIKSEAQWDRNSFNKTQWNRPGLNRTQWNTPSLDRTQSNVPNVNRTQWNTPLLNRTQGHHQHFNRTQWNLQVLDRAQNPTQWQIDAIDRYQINAKNRTNGRLQHFNRTLGIGSRHDATNWSTRTKRKEPKWVAPAAVPIGNTTWNQTTHNGDLIVGQVGYLDRLLFNQTYKKERRWWSGREKIIEYPNDLPGKYSFNRQETISAVRIYNKFYDGLEAQAEILSGGVGYRYAKIRLSSPWNRGFQYLVQIFGR